MKTLLRLSLFFLPQFAFPGWVFCFASQNIAAPFLAMFLHFGLVYFSGYLLIARFEAPTVLAFQALIYCCSLALQTVVAMRLLPMVLRNHAGDSADASLDSSSVSLRSTIPFLIFSLSAFTFSHYKGWSVSFVKKVALSDSLNLSLNSTASARFCTKGVSEQFRVSGPKKFLGHLVQVNLHGKTILGRIVATDQEKVLVFSKQKDTGCIGTQFIRFQASGSLLGEIENLKTPPRKKLAVVHEKLQKSNAEGLWTTSAIDLSDIVCLVSDAVTHADSQFEKSLEGC